MEGTLASFMVDGPGESGFGSLIELQPISMNIFGNAAEERALNLVRFRS